MNEQQLYAVLDGIRVGVEHAMKALGQADREATAPPAPATKTPEAPPPAASPPEVPPTAPATQAPPATAVVAGGPLTGAQIDAMTRPEIVRYLEDRGIPGTAEFKKQVGPALKGIRVTTLQTFLKEYLAGGDSEPPASRQAPAAPPAPAEEPPPAAKPALVPPPAAAPPPAPTFSLQDPVAWGTISVPPTIPPEAMHPEVQANEELRDEAQQVMNAIASWTQDPQHAGNLRNFMAQQGCNGLCVLHSEAAIKNCIRRLSASG